MIVVIKNTKFVANKNEPKQPTFAPFSRKDWLRAIKPSTWGWEQSTKPIWELSKPHNSESRGTAMPFGGLAGFLYFCWANELPVQLSPQLFQERILSELSSLVTSSPDDFRSIFSTKQEKTTLNNRVSTFDQQIDIDNITKQLQDNIPSQELLNVVLKKFSTDDSYSFLSRQLVLCNMASPYYDYMTSMCGFPSMSFAGTSQDWFTVSQTISTLVSLILPLIKQEEKQKLWTRYLQACQEVVLKIRKIADGLMKESDAVDFVHNTIYHQPNKKCGSGHTENVLSGWILDLYIHSFEKKKPTSQVVEMELDDFSQDVHYITWANIETGRKFLCSIGIISCEENSKGFMIPVYSKLMEEVIDEAYFCALANKELPAMHKGVSCDGCGVNPISGKRFKCGTCPNFDFCETCLNGKQHPHQFNEISLNK